MEFTRLGGDPDAEFKLTLKPLIYKRIWIVMRSRLKIDYFFILTNFLLYWLVMLDVKKLDN